MGAREDAQGRRKNSQRNDEWKKENKKDRSRSVLAMRFSMLKKGRKYLYDPRGAGFIQQRRKEEKRERSNLLLTNLPLSNVLQFPKNDRRDLLRRIPQHPLIRSVIAIRSLGGSARILDFNLNNRRGLATVMFDLER